MAEARLPGQIRFVEAAAPGTPPSGYVYVYAKADGKIYFKDDAGTETACGGGVGTGDLLSTNNLSDVDDAQTAINNITAVAGATNEHVLTKDTATGNAVFKAAGGSGLTQPQVMARGVFGGPF